MTGTCTCWVQQQPLERRYDIPWGAHGLECPWYHSGRNTVDQYNDERIRSLGEWEAKRW